MRQTCPIILLTILLGTPPAGPLAADVVYTMDGKVYEGEVTREDGRVYIQLEYARIELKAADIRKIVKTDGQTSPEEDAPAPPTVDRGPSIAPSLLREVTNPEAMVFLYMRRLAAAPPGLGSYSVGKELTRWRKAVHDQHRRINGQWVGPEEFQVRRRRMQQHLDKAEEILRERRSIRGEGRKEEAQRRALSVAASREMHLAARSWPDPVLREFLDGVAALTGDNPNAALRPFRLCCEAMPLVAAFHQGRTLALRKANEPFEALGSALKVVALEPRSRDAVTLLDETLQAVSGEKLQTERFQKARSLLDSYGDSVRRYSSRRGGRWLLPGKVSGDKDSLPIPKYDRFVLRQAPAVVVGPYALLADEAALKDADRVYVKLPDGLYIPAKLQRAARTRGRKSPPLLIVNVGGAKFTAVEYAEEAAFVAGDPVTVHTAESYSELGEQINTFAVKLKPHGEQGALRPDHTLAAGHAAGPVVSAKGMLVGFFAGRTDPMEDNAGPDEFIPAADLASTVSRAQRMGAASLGYGSRNEEPPAAEVAGQVLMVYGLHLDKVE